MYCCSLVGVLLSATSGSLVWKTCEFSFRLEKDTYLKLLSGSYSVQKVVDIVLFQKLGLEFLRIVFMDTVDDLTETDYRLQLDSQRCLDRLSGFRQPVSSQISLERV